MKNPSKDIPSLPPQLPVPQDDGGCDHLTGMTLPTIELPSTAGRTVNLFEVTQELTVLFFYPRTSKLGEPVPQAWNDIPGARGCTAQTCAYREHFSSFKALGANVFGVSTQMISDQTELLKRIHLPYELLSDHQLELARKLMLPTFQYNGMTLIKRLTCVCKKGRIQKVFYPVFPPDRSAETVLNWLKLADDVEINPDEGES